MSLRSTKIGSHMINDGIDTMSLILYSTVIIGILSELNQQINEFTEEDKLITEHVIPMLHCSSCNQYHAL